MNRIIKWFRMDSDSEIFFYFVVIVVVEKKDQWMNKTKQKTNMMDLLHFFFLFFSFYFISLFIQTVCVNVMFSFMFHLGSLFYMKTWLAIKSSWHRQYKWIVQEEFNVQSLIYSSKRGCLGYSLRIKSFVVVVVVVVVIVSYRTDRNNNNNNKEKDRDFFPLFSLIT